jgi:hypothetical protein
MKSIDIDYISRFKSAVGCRPRDRWASVPLLLTNGIWEAQCLAAIMTRSEAVILSSRGINIYDEKVQPNFFRQLLLSINELALQVLKLPKQERDHIVEMIDLHMQVDVAY